MNDSTVLLRQYANALDADRGHDKSMVTAVMREAANEIEALRQFVCSRCGRFGCLDRICHGGVDV